MSYPTEQQLKTIKNWDLTKKPVIELLDFVEPLWEYPDRFIRKRHTLYLSTGGWSGNEDIISALRHNFLFWSMYWQESHRGGHYWFNDSMVSDELKGFTLSRKRTIKSPPKPLPSSLQAIREAVKKAPPKRSTGITTNEVSNGMDSSPEG